MAALILGCSQFVYAHNERLWMKLTTFADFYPSSNHEIIPIFTNQIWQKEPKRDSDDHKDVILQLWEIVMVTEKINATDKYVGDRVRARWLALGMSQTLLATAIGVTFQQVQKYEKGKNQISASRLSQIAHVLKVSIAYFFESVPSKAPKGKANTPSTAYLTEFVSSAEGIAFIKAFREIDDTRLRRHIVDLVDYIAMTYDEN